VVSLAAGHLHSLAVAINWRQTDEEIAEDYKLKSMAKKKQQIKSGQLDKCAKFKAEGMTSKEKRLEDKKKHTKDRKKRVAEAEKLGRLRMKPNAEVRTLYSWGDGTKGQLGHGELYTAGFFKTQSGNKESVNQLKAKNFSCTGAPRKVVALLPKDGQKENPLGVLVQVYASGSNSAALTNKGTVLTWGDNTYGQLGLGDKKERNVPCIIDEGWLKVNKIEERMLDLALTNYSMLALSTNYHVYSWGNGSGGCLGYGKDHTTGEIITDDELKPRIIDKVSSRGVMEIAAGHHHCLVRTSVGQLYTWGLASSGRLGLKEHDEGVCYEPELVASLEKADVEIGLMAGGGAHSIVATSMFPADDVAGKFPFSSAMEPPGGPVVQGNILLSACCVIS